MEQTGPRTGPPEPSDEAGDANAAPSPAGRSAEDVGWREATESALYGPNGFYRRPEGPAGHFRTSVHASPQYAQAIATLLTRVDAALGHPAELTLLDVGAGRGELLRDVLAALDAADPLAAVDVLDVLDAADSAAGGGAGATAGEAGARAGGGGATAGEGDATAGGSGRAARGLVSRLRPCAVERAERPAGLDPRIEWLAELPAPGSLTGLLIANEWLDNVPLDVVEVAADGMPHLVRVAPDGTERLGGPVSAADAAWLAAWWPLGPEPGLRAELGAPRDAAWARAVACLHAGLAVAVDYAHERAERPPYGTLTGFRAGREVRPVPDGSCDLTAHVALDACAAGVAGMAEVAGATGAAEVVGVSGVAEVASTAEMAGAVDAASAAEVAGAAESSPQAPAPASPQAPTHGTDTPAIRTQRAALHALGVRGRRPPLAQASSDPVGYLRALGAAGAAAELTDPAGLGRFRWLCQPVRGLSVDRVLPQPPRDAAETRRGELRD
ncbi:SAM-dependent methyltransferase [Streptomyces sp. HSW2009]|uniref:SAM-dependent methyltransferase n=1 Tax=Streptomyces sp. HSW2009 TaxID=3142890 RepID=UPI0032F035E6